jgi:phage shock protein C
MASDSPRRLTRSQDRKVAGVCGGVAEYFGADPTLVRLGFVALAVLTAFGPMLLGYAILWIVMPEASGPPASRPASTGDSRQAGTVIGIVLLALGFMWLMGRGWGGVGHMPMFGWSGFQFLWIFGLIIVGALIIGASRRGR